jgi:O-antigen/teichoic acid export membrane protein
MSPMTKRLHSILVRFLRWSERYTKTDMVYLANVGWWTNLTLILTSFGGLLISIVFANFLSPQTYGVYQYLLALSGLVAAISLSGMNTAVTQAAARGYEGVLRAAVRAQFQWAIIPALVSVAGSLYYFAHGTIELGIGLLAIALLTPFVNAFNTYGAFLAGKREFRSDFYFTASISIVYYASMFFVALFFKDAAVLITVNLGVNALGMGYAYWRTLAKYKKNDELDPKAVSYGKHLSVLSAFGIILTQLDSILVFHFLGAAQLAVYAFSTLIPERVASLFNFIGLASLPKFANQPLEYIQKNIVPKILRIAAAGVVVALFYAVLAPLLFHILFSRYVAAISYTQLYAPIIALTAVLNTVQTTFAAKRLTKEIYVLGLVQPVLLVGLQIPFLLAYGILGMLVARMTSDLIGIVLSLTLLFMRRPTHVE